jgi:dihydrofolate reductase
MSKVRVAAFAISVDGYGAGADQRLDAPIGRGGEQLMQWFFPTRTFQRRINGQPDGETGVDDDFAARSFENVGAWIIGRNMFGPANGEWPDDWKGWWGPNPPFHMPVFVLTHRPHPKLEMEGGTVFHFVKDRIEAVLELARQAASGKDVRIGGGVAIVRAYLKAALIDELHLAVAPVLLGSGEHLMSRIDLPALGYRVEEQARSAAATHLILRRG